MTRYLLIAAAIAGVVFLCSRVLAKRTPAQRLAALQEEVRPQGGIVFQTKLEGEDAAFLLLNCKVYLLDSTRHKVKRTKVLQPGFYLGFTACTGQSIHAEDEYVIATLENRAIGAGGGNTSGGTYRSKDGVRWEKRTSKGWVPAD